MKVTDLIAAEPGTENVANRGAAASEGWRKLLVFYGRPSILGHYPFIGAVGKPDALEWYVSMNGGTSNLQDVYGEWGFDRYAGPFPDLGTAYATLILVLGPA